MMVKLAARDNETNRHFKPQIYQSRRRGQSRNSYDAHNHDRGNYQNRYRSDNHERRNQYSKVEVDQGMNKIIGEEILETM